MLGSYVDEVWLICEHCVESCLCEFDIGRFISAQVVPQFIKKDGLGTDTWHGNVAP